MIPVTSCKSNMCMQFVAICFCDSHVIHMTPQMVKQYWTKRTSYYYDMYTNITIKLKHQHHNINTKINHCGTVTMYCGWWHKHINNKFCCYLVCKQEQILTLLLDLPDLLHCLLEDGTFIWLDVEVIHVIDVSEDQLCQLLDVLVLLLPVSPLSVPLRAK